MALIAGLNQMLPIAQGAQRRRGMRQRVLVAIVIAVARQSIVLPKMNYQALVVAVVWY
jgi:hypothetical protein